MSNARVSFFHAYEPALTWPANCTKLNRNKSDQALT